MTNSPTFGVRALLLTPDVARQLLDGAKEIRNPSATKEVERLITQGNWIDGLGVIRGTGFTADDNFQMIDGQRICRGVVSTGQAQWVVLTEGLSERARITTNFVRTERFEDILRKERLVPNARRVGEVVTLSFHVAAGRGASHATGGGGYRPNNFELLDFYDQCDRETWSMYESSVAGENLSRTAHGSARALSAAVFFLHQLDSTLSTQFFEDLTRYSRDKTGLDRGDPVIALAYYLNWVQNETAPKTLLARPRPAAQLAAIFNAWKARRDGRSLRVTQGRESTPQLHWVKGDEWPVLTEGAAR